VPAGLKRFLVFLACVLVAWYAHRPLLGAGFLGSDAAVLVDVAEAQGEHGALAPWAVEAVDHRPLAMGSLALSRRLHSRDGVYTPGDAGRLRLESLILLVIAAFGVRAAVIRALRPWTGSDHARAAGAASGALLMFHPLLVPVVAHLPARGDVVALAASAWSTALLLRGRQERDAIALGGAFALALAAAAASPSALLLVPLGFGLEFFAARRHRPLPVRVRTAVHVALGYAAALLVEAAARALLQPAPSPGAAAARAGFDPEAVLFAAEGGLARALGVAAETTGVVVLPVNTTGLGFLGYVPAVIALLLALHPGFVAARAAPRLWGRVLGGWAIAVAVLLVLGTGGARTVPAELADAPGTMSLALAMAVGLGISSTALSGGRRTVLPAIAGGLYALLTAGSAATVRWAAADVGAVHDVILEAAAEDEWERAETWVLDPPRRIYGVDALSPEDDAALTSGPFLPRGAQPVSVRGLPASSFWALSRGDAFRDARAGGLTLLLPRSPGNDAADTPAVELTVLRIDPPAPGTSIAPRRAIGWVGEGTSPAARAFDPFEIRHAVALAPADATAAEVVAEPPMIRWAGERSSDRVHQGVWVMGDEGPEARFALERDAAWLLGGEVRSIWFSGPLEKAVSVRMATDPPMLPAHVVPRVVGDDWTFDIAAVDLAAPIDPAANEVWELRVIDPVSGREVRIAPTGAGSGRLVAPDAARFGAYDVLWILDRSLDGVVVERAEGLRRAVPPPAAGPDDPR